MTLGSGVVTKSWLHECARSAAKRIVMAAFMSHVFFGRKPEHETLCFPCEVASAGDERYLVCPAGAARSFWCVIGSLMVFCNAWFVVCA